MIVVPAPESHRLHHVVELTGTELVPSAESPVRVDSIMEGLADAGFAETDPNRNLRYVSPDMTRFR